MNNPNPPVPEAPSPIAILEAVISIQAEIDVMEQKFKWRDWIGIVVLAVAVVTVCAAVVAAGFGTGPVTGGTSIAAAIVACIVAIWWFIDHCLDTVEATEEMLEEQDTIREQVRAVEERLGIPVPH